MHSLLLQERQISLNAKKIYLMLLACYLVLKPFYIFQSGLPQAADVILSVLIFFSLFMLEKETFNHNPFILWGAVFLYYSIIVNVIWGIVEGGRLELVGTSLFYLFNLVVFIVFIQISTKSGKLLFMRTVHNAIAFSVIIQCFLIPFFLHKDGMRTTLMFNNPNQLGYFGLLSLAILLVTASNLKIRPLFFFLSILACLALIIISLSKAAIISGLFTLFFFLFVRNPQSIGSTTAKRYLLLLIGLLLALFLINAKVMIHSTIVQDVVHRLDSIGQQNDDSLEGRGYDRIIKHPYYVFLGAGEGLYERFHARQEMHSTFGNILFSYGIIGLILFAVFFYQAVSNLKLSRMYPLFAVVLFGLTHNGIRNTLLWLLLVLLYISKTNTEDSFPS